MTQLLPSSPLAEQAQQALRRHAWGEAYELLKAADTPGALSSEELLLLAEAAWWVGKLPASIDAHERAYAAAVKAGRPEQAAMAAVLLGRDHVLRNSHPVATAWLKRAEHLLETLPESPLNGWLAATRAFQHGLTGPIEVTLANADVAADVAKRFGDRDLAALAMSCRGIGLVSTGQVQEGLAILDEAAAGAVAGELEPDTAGGVCCAVIGACTALGDVERAVQWTEAQDRWCEREGINGYPGMCRLYRAEIKSLRGDWLEAEAEARRASEELPGFIPAAVSQAHYQIGEIRLRRGDLPAAEEALLAAHATGRAEPALSLLRHAQGRTEAALESITRALDGSSSPPSWGSTPDSDLTRTLLLPALVEIAIAAGEPARARAGVDELAELAERFDAPAVRARAATTAAMLEIAEGDHRVAIAHLQSATRVWQELDAPWEGARARRLLGEALAADGARESAALELRAARAALERLGAVPELRRVDAALASIGAATGEGPGASPERVLRTFVFTDIVDSTRLGASVGDEAWDRALRWHDRTIRTLTAEHGGEEIKRTGDGFFLAFDDPDRAIDCAIGIQRRLAEPPADLGVPVAVRIGVHRAEANRSGLDYLGSGVNLAARITREAGGGEVLVSHATLDATRRRYAAADEREVTLRGVAEPVPVATVPWRVSTGAETESGVLPAEA